MAELWLTMVNYGYYDISHVSIYHDSRSCGLFFASYSSGAPPCYTNPIPLI